MAPEKTTLPVTIIRGTGEISVDLNPEDILDLKQGDESITRVKLMMSGANVAILQKFLGGVTMPQGLPDITQEQASGMIEQMHEEGEEAELRALVDAALSASVDRCARCKVCDAQVDAVMAALGYPPKNAN